VKRRDLPAICAEIEKAKKEGISKKQLLLNIAKIPGVYIPAFYDVTYHEDGRVKAITPNEPGIPARITKAIIKDLNQFASFADRWTFDNQDSNIPRISTSSSNGLFSSRIIEDGSYLRLKTLSLGYTFDKKLLKKVKISNARVYISGQNLFTLTKYSGYDPEVSIRNTALTPNLDFSAYPRAASVNAGLNLSF
jgi:hypothetical protein